MLAPRFLSCLGLIVAGQMVGALIATLTAMSLFPVFDGRAVALIVLGSMLGLALTLAILCEVVKFKTADRDDDEPPLGIGA